MALLISVNRGVGEGLEAEPVCVLQNPSSLMDKIQIHK